MNGSRVGDIGLSVTGDIAQNIALPVVGLSAGGIQLDGLFVSCQGFVVAFEVVESMTHVGVRGSIGGAQPNGSRMGSESLHGTVEPSEGEPLLVVDIGVAGVELYGLLVCSKRFCVALEC